MVKRKTAGRKRTVKGSGILSDLAGSVGKAVGYIPKTIGTVLNKGVDLLPVELHLPGGYQYCGPGTKLKERLARGDLGINRLDQACKVHDIAYSRYKDTANRAKADKELAEKAWSRFKASDSSIGEKAAAFAVSAAMKAKSKFGGGRKRKGKGLYLKPFKRSGRGSKKGKGLYLKPFRKCGKGKVTKRRGSKKKKLLDPAKTVNKYRTR